VLSFFRCPCTCEMGCIEGSSFMYCDDTMIMGIALMIMPDLLCTKVRLMGPCAVEDSSSNQVTPCVDRCTNPFISGTSTRTTQTLRVSSATAVSCPGRRTLGLCGNYMVCSGTSSASQEVLYSQLHSLGLLTRCVWVEPPCCRTARMCLLVAMHAT
jgi:hypothetical protein